MNKSKINKMRMLFVAAAVAAMLALPAGVARASMILFHGAGAAATVGADAAVLAHLQSVYGAANVTYMQGTAAAADGSSAAGYDAVIISSTINSADCRNKYEDATVGVLTWEPGLVQDNSVGNFFMCDTNNAVTNQTQITIVDANSPLAAGLSGTVTVTSSGQSFQTGTGVLGAGVDLVASTMNGQHAILAADVGDALLGTGAVGSPSVAAGRRVFFFLHDSTFSALTADGLKLFDAAVAYVTYVPPEPEIAYWDLNGTSANACIEGNTAPGTWGGANNWNAVADGTGPTSAWTAGRTAVFAAGGDATGTYTVTVEGTRDIGGLVFEEGTVTLMPAAGGELRLTKDDAAVDVASGLTATVATPITQDATARNLLKKGDGTLILSGANTYTGGTTIQAGTLRLGADNVLPDTGGVTIRGNAPGVIATLDLDGNSDTIGSLTLGGLGQAGGAAVTIGAGTLTLGGNVTYDNANAPLGATISGIGGGKLDLGIATRTFTVSDSTTAADDLTVSADISGTGVGLIKEGGGKLVLSGNNTYSGTTTVKAGMAVFTTRASLYNDTPANWTPTKITVDSGATLALGVGANASGYFDTGDLDTFLAAMGASTASTGLKTGAILGLDTTNADGGTFTPSAAIALPTGVGLAKLGAGTLVLSAANTYTGATTVSAGTLQLSHANAIASSSGLIMNGGSAVLGTTVNLSALTFTATAGSASTVSGGTLNFAPGGSITVESDGTIESGITGSPVVTLNVADLALAPTGAGMTVGTIFSNAGKITLGGTTGGNSVASIPKVTLMTVNKEGTGTWTVGDVYGGYININAGTLIANGKLWTDYRYIALNAGATLCYNNPGAVQVVGVTRYWGLNGGNLDNTSGAAITTSTYNPWQQWMADFTFIGSNGPASDLYLGTGAVTLTASRTVTVQNAATTLTVGGAIGDGGGGYGLTKAGDGTLKLTGASTYSGGTTVNAGTLLVSNASGSGTGTGDVTVNEGGALGGTGTIAGAVTVADGGAVVWDFDGTTGSKLTVGNLEFNTGWILRLSGTGTPAFGSEYDLFTYTGSFSGSLSAIIDAADVTGWPTPTVVQETGRVFLTFGQAGDTNGDGVVDAADYITLKKNFGKTTGSGASAGDFNNSGTVNWADLNILTKAMAGGAGAPAVTPEPATLGLLAIGALAVMRRRRK